ncbi:MAG: ATP synthase F1 subunit gamma [Rickettsiaceae bacterium]
MSNLKQISNRIKTINSTKKTTKAMQMVSASKLKKAKEVLLASDLRIQSMKNIVGNIISNVSDFSDLDNLFLSLDKHRSNESAKLLIIFASNRGLCGGFNNSIIKKSIEDIETFKKGNQEIKLIIVGTKAYSALSFMGYKDYIDSYYEIKNENEQELIFNVLYNRVVQLIESCRTSFCYLYFNKFKNAMTQIPTRLDLLPYNFDKDFIQSDYDYEGENLLYNAMGFYIKSAINFAFSQSYASENAARMISMDNATKNATKLSRELTLSLNRSRQALITTELTEIISGAEAV